MMTDMGKKITVNISTINSSAGVVMAMVVVT